MTQVFKLIHFQVFLCRDCFHKFVSKFSKGIHTQWKNQINYNTFSMFPALIVLEWKHCSMPAFCSISFDNSASNGRSSPDTDSVRMGWRSRTSLALELVPDLHSLFPILSRIFVVLLDHCYPYCVWDLFHFPTSRLHKNIKMLVKKRN